MNNKTSGQQKEEIELEIHKKFWAVYSDNTKTLSSICRQLAFGEGGVCWFFIQEAYFSFEIKLILTFLLLFFVADAGQYLFLATNNKKQAEFYEELLNRNDPVITNKEQVQRPIKINSAGNICFGLKLISLAIASLLLIATFYYNSNNINAGSIKPIVKTRLN
ncbi:hypothetical protein [Legionella sp. WA2024007413]